MVQQSTNAPDVSPPVAWVIGGTRGIGAAVVEHLARDGWTVVASGRGEAALERTDEGRWWRPVDIRDGAAVEGAAAELAQRLGRLDAAVVSVREQGEGSFADPAVDRPDGAHTVHQEADRIVVAFVQREPGEDGSREYGVGSRGYLACGLVLLPYCILPTAYSRIYPFAQQRGFPLSLIHI